MAATGGPGRQGPLRDDLPPDPREDAGPDDLSVRHRSTSSARTCCRASSRATRRSTTTRPATSATGSGSCARPSASARGCGDGPRDAARAVAVGGRGAPAGAATARPDMERLGRQHRRCPRVRARRADPPPGHHRRAARQPLGSALRSRGSNRARRGRGAPHAVPTDHLGQARMSRRSIAPVAALVALGLAAGTATVADRIGSGATARSRRRRSRATTRARTRPAARSASTSSARREQAARRELRRRRRHGVLERLQRRRQSDTAGRPHHRLRRQR